MDWVPNLVPYFPAFFRYSTAFNFGQIKFHRGQHTLRIISSIVLLLYITYRSAEEEKITFAMVHDGSFILMFFLAIELSLVMKNKELTSLVNFITEPIKVGRSLAKRSKYHTYIKRLSLYGLSPPFSIASLGIVWPLMPSILYMSGYDQSSVDQPFIWMLTSDSSCVISTAFLVFYMVSNVSLMQGWFLILAVAVTKLNLLTGLLEEDLSDLDEMAEERCEELLDAWTTTRKLPLCQECRERFSDVTKPVVVDQLGLSAVLDARRRCCRQAFQDQILEYCHTKCLESVIVQHQKIIRLTRTLNEVYKMTTWSFSQASILYMALVLPQLDKLMERNLAENAFAFMEVLCTPLCITIFCYFGNSLLCQSERIRFALYSCSWTAKPNAFRKTILLMQTVANRDLRLTAGGIYTLNLKLLSTFFQSVYTYCKILQWLKLQGRSKHEQQC